MGRPLARDCMRLIGRRKSWIRVVKGGAGHKCLAVTSDAACYVVGHASSPARGALGRDGASGPPDEVSGEVVVVSRSGNRAWWS